MHAGPYGAELLSDTPGGRTSLGCRPTCPPYGASRSPWAPGRSERGLPRLGTPCWTLPRASAWRRRSRDVRAAGRHRRAAAPTARRRSPDRCDVHGIRVEALWW